MEDYSVCSSIFLLYTHGIIYLINKRSNTLSSKLKQALESNKNAYIQLQETMKSRDIFFASVSHDLRNPLHSVIGGLEYLETDRMSNQAVEVISNSKLCGEVLLNLINNLLDTTKLEAGKMELY